jgi:hypothetical protein
VGTGAECVIELLKDAIYHEAGKGRGKRVTLRETIFLGEGVKGAVWWAMKETEVGMVIH